MPLRDLCLFLFFFPFTLFLSLLQRLWKSGGRMGKLRRKSEKTKKSGLKLRKLEMGRKERKRVLEKGSDAVGCVYACAPHVCLDVMSCAKIISNLNVWIDLSYQKKIHLRIFFLVIKKNVWIALRHKRSLNLCRMHIQFNIKLFCNIYKNYF